MPTTARRFWIETLGCPKNQVDTDKLTGALHADGLVPAGAPDQADLVVVNTCAFVEQARQESIEAILELSDQRHDGAELVVTGCMAERYGDELANELPEVDAVVGFGVPVTLQRRSSGTQSFDLLNLPRPRTDAPWAYVKVAEGCDRACGYCAIPSFRGRQRSRAVDDILREVVDLDVREVVLVAQDLASFGRDQGHGERLIVPLVSAIAEEVDWVRLLYLYPADMTSELVDAILGTGVPYFDLSLQHVSASLLRSMRRWGSGEQFLSQITAIRAAEPDAAFRSNFIVGYPGESDDDHVDLLEFIEVAQLDWCGFFAYSEEAGTHASGLEGAVDPLLVTERLAELRDRQDDIMTARRLAAVGTRLTVLVDGPGEGRSHREAPEIDGAVLLPASLEPGTFADVEIVDAIGPDLVSAGAMGSPIEPLSSMSRRSSSVRAVAS